MADALSRASSTLLAPAQSNRNAVSRRRARHRYQYPDAPQCTAGARKCLADRRPRANVPRVLGELTFLLEYRLETIDLQFSRGFALPPNIAFSRRMDRTRLRR
jgi:hypothetical protein